MKFDTLVDLLRNALCGVAIRRREGLVDTERAAARRDPPITIGAAQRRIDRELLHPTAHQPAKVGRIAIETAVIHGRFGNNTYRYSYICFSLSNLPYCMVTVNIFSRNGKFSIASHPNPHP